jgi:hypothetical protein
MNGPDAREYIYNAWAPHGSVWSPWAKPVLFSVMGRYPLPPTLPSVTFDLSWVPAVNRGAALILDLPREEGVLMGLELAKLGYRPVPLYNALPGPAVPILSIEPAPASVVEVMPILHALWRGAEELLKLIIPPNAPPVFLLDANRSIGWRIKPVCFDNRSVSFVTDFPSAKFLKDSGIGRAILVQRFQDQPQPDLAHTLRRWHDGGIEVESKRFDQPGAPHPLVLKHYSWWRDFWYRLGTQFWLVPHRLGGYGGVVGDSAGG